MTVTDIIVKYGLQEHPEGGFFREVYRSEAMVESPVVGEPRNAVTDIYFLLADGQVSRFHAVSHDEIWHFYGGDALILVQLDSDGTTETRLGDRLGDSFKHVVKGDTYQAAYTTGGYSFVGCTVAPGFDFADFRFLKDDPDAADLVAALDDKYRHLL